MSDRAKLLLACGLALVLTACAGTRTATSPIQDVEGRTVYTQRNMWINGDEHLATNYRAGWLLPANSRVRIADTSGQEIIVEVVDGGERFTLANIPEYTKLDMQGIYDRYFGSGTVDLGRFPGDVRQAIEEGEIVTGMSKDAVLIARGYPPAHETPSLERDAWKYWRGRYNTVLVRFNNDRVSSIKD